MGAKEMADSAQIADAPRVNGTVVAVPTPVLYSLHPYTEEQVPPSVYPLPAVKEEVLEAVSALPITNEFELGVKEVTAGVVEPPEELPVEVDELVAVALEQASVGSLSPTVPIMK